MIEPCRTTAMTGDHVAAVAGLCRALGYDAPHDRVRECSSLLEREAGHALLAAHAFYGARGYRGAGARLDARGPGPYMIAPFSAPDR